MCVASREVTLETCGCWLSAAYVEQITGEKEPEDVIAADTNTFAVGDSAHVSWIQSMSQHPTWSFWSPGTKAGEGEDCA